MKYLYFFVISMIIGVTCFAQTATNFTCNDCSGGSHDLFTELNSGKVVVLCWVMPCSSCIPASKTTYNVVTSYQTNHPDSVLFYLIDDLGDTPCSSLSSWANTNHIAESTYSKRFVNTAINMSDYGASGMPKIVVLGGISHSVFYNVNTSVIATELQVAIDNALISTSSITSNNSDLFNVSLSPIPANVQTTLNVSLNSNLNVKVEVYNVVGKKVADVFNNQLKTGDNNLNINTANFNNGMYFVKVTVADKIKIIKLIVSE